MFGRKEQPTEWSLASVSASETFHVTLQLGRKQREWPEYEQGRWEQGITEQQEQRSNRETWRERRKKPCPAQEQLLLTVLRGCESAEAGRHETRY